MSTGVIKGLLNDYAQHICVCGEERCVSNEYPQHIVGEIRGASNAYHNICFCG